MALRGIDIASYQAGIDLSKMSTTEFVIIKATQGRTYTNPSFNKQLSSAMSAGKLIGFYHYASSGGYALEAEHFLNVVTPYLGKAILVLDWESGSNKNFQNPAYARGFLDYVYQKTKVRPLIYMSQSVCNQFDWTDVAKNYGLWVAQYKNMRQTGYQAFPSYTRKLGAWSSPAILQYTSCGIVPGWVGELDLDKAYMDKKAWQKYATGDRDAVVQTSNVPASGQYNVGNYLLSDIQYDPDHYSEEVKFLQQLLNAKDHAAIQEDGYCGVATLQAIAYRQATIMHTTVCDKATWESLIN